MSCKQDDLAPGLGSASGSRDDVLGSPSATTPQLPRGAIPAGFWVAVMHGLWSRVPP